MSEMITLSNDFHATTARVRSGNVSPATVRRLRRELCGSRDCLCGGELGQRGAQIQPSGKATAEIQSHRPGECSVTWVNHDGNR